MRGTRRKKKAIVRNSHNGLDQEAGGKTTEEEDTDSNYYYNDYMYYEHADDGGSGKGDGRRFRRVKDRLSKVLYVVIGLCVLILMHLTMKERRKLDWNMRQSRAQFFRSQMGLSNEHVREEDTVYYGSKNGGKSSSSQETKYRWSNPMMLPAIPGKENNRNTLGDRNDWTRKGQFKVKRRGHTELDAWMADADDDTSSHHVPRSIDYTKHAYEYPSPLLSFPPKRGYPTMRTLGEILSQWPQDELDHPPSPIVEVLQHFDYSDDQQRQMALNFRSAELPFKVYNVPEIDAAGEKWTDEYVAAQFDKTQSAMEYNDKQRQMRNEVIPPRSHGHCQEGVDNFFAFFHPEHWNSDTMGPPPTMDNDWTFAKWAKHARYADTVQLKPTDRHYYWQMGVPREERLKGLTHWTFVSRDLPSFSNPDPTFFGFNPKEQKGIQCRFGERGVTAATHYDAGRNMIAMITGAKRYILSPPKMCPKLGIVTKKAHPTFRHSLLNFGHINLLNTTDPDAKTMPNEEREWLEVAKSSLAIETVLKAGEVLYVPSHWFHYITSLQKSAQCNTRSGREKGGTPEFGGYDDVVQCVGEDA